MKKLKRSLSVFLAWIMLIAWPIPVNADSVIYISSEKDLKNIANNPYGHYVLTADIVLSDTEWMSLGKFCGILDGAGYTISNLTSTTGQGLFDVLTSEATVKNLTVSGNVSAVGGNISLLAYSSAGYISNCTTKGTVRICDDSADVVNSTENDAGYVYESEKAISIIFNDCSSGMVVLNSGHMVNCVNEADVINGSAGITSNNVGSIIGCENRGNIVSPAMYPGGIVGINNYLVKGCTNIGNITAISENTNSALAAGGIVGSNKGLVMDCVNRGEVKLTVIRSDSIGGIAGATSGFSQVVNCENYGKISGPCIAGGICGDVSLTSGTFDENDQFVVTAGELLIANCVNNGIVQAENAVAETLPPNTTKVGASRAGGIAGDITNRSGKISVINCINNGSIIGLEKGTLAGGIVPEIYASDKGEVIFKNLCNSGDVSCGYSAGGIFSAIQNYGEQKFNITYCKNEGSISARSAYGIGNLRFNGYMQYCSNLGNVYGSGGASGLVDWLETGSEIYDCYNLGTVSGNSAVGIVSNMDSGTVVKNTYSAGQLEGVSLEYAYCSSEISDSTVYPINSYYEEQNFVSEQKYGSLLTSEQMQEESSYIGFDFNNIWEMKEQNGRILPALKEYSADEVFLEADEISLELGDTFEPKAESGSIVSYYSSDCLKIHADLLNSDEYKLIALGEGTAEVYCVFSDGQVVPCTVNITKKVNTVEDFVSRMYNIALNREPDEAGLENWKCALINHQIDGAGIAQNFVLGDEFTSRGLSDEEYVAALYQIFFDRAGDSEGVETWMSVLDAGASRTLVLAEFVNSQEFSYLCDSFQIARGTMQVDGSVQYNKGVRDFVVRLYEKVLGRNGETLGVEHWTNCILLNIVTPKEVAKEYYFSDEFLLQNTTNSDFVETLYQAFMDRESDSAGKEFWIYYLECGGTRESIIDEFSDSEEFKIIMARYGL